MWVWGLKGLKGICHEDIAILGQFCAEIMTFVAFTYTQNVPCRVMKKIPNKFHRGAQTINFLLSFASSASKLEKSGPTFSRFNPCPDDKK